MRNEKVLKYASQQLTGRNSLNQPHAFPKTGRASSIFSQRNVQREKEANLRVLSQFLLDHNFPDEVSQRTLKSPATNYVKNIFLFLFNKFNPNFTDFERFSDDVKTLLSLYGFPFSLAKSYLQAPSAPSSWPYVLSSIVWLIEIFEYGANESAENSGKSPLRDMEITAEQYKSFLSGSDMEEVQQKIREIHEEKQRELREKEDALAAKAESLRGEIAVLEAKPTSAQKAALASKLRTDAENFERLIESKRKHIEALESKSAEYRKGEKKLHKQLKQVEQQEDYVKYELGKQKIKREDVVQMNRESHRLRKELAMLSKKLHSKNQLVEKSESARRSRKTDVNTAAERLNDRLRAISVVPSDAKLAYDNDYTLAVNHLAEVLPNEDDAMNIRRITSIDLKGSLKSHLRQIQKLLTEEKINQQGESTRLANYLQDLGDRMQREAREKDEAHLALENLKSLNNARAKQFEDEREKANHEIFSKKMGAFSAENAPMPLFDLIGALGKLEEKEKIGKITQTKARREKTAQIMSKMERFLQYREERVLEFRKLEDCKNKLLVAFPKV